MYATVAQTAIAAAATATNLERLGVAFRPDEDVVATEGYWFFEVDVTSDLLVFACLYASDGEASLSIDVRSRADDGEPVARFGGVDHEGLLPGATIAALIRGAAALAREGRAIG